MERIGCYWWLQICDPVEPLFKWNLTWKDLRLLFKLFTKLGAHVWIPLLRTHTDYSPVVETWMPCLTLTLEFCDHRELGGSQGTGPMNQAAGCTQGDQDNNCLPTLKFTAVLVTNTKTGNQLVPITWWMDKENVVFSWQNLMHPSKAEVGDPWNKENGSDKCYGMMNLENMMW